MCVSYRDFKIYILNDHSIHFELNSNPYKPTLFRAVHASNVIHCIVIYLAKLTEGLKIMKMGVAQRLVRQDRYTNYAAKKTTTAGM